MSANVLPFSKPTQRATDVAGVADEIKALFLIGLTGEQVRLPFVCYGHQVGQDTETSQTLRDVLVDGLDHDAEHAAFMRVLAESTCPLVRDLRLAFANGYADRNASEIAELRSTRHE